jgi:hypothetical protein
VGEAVGTHVLVDRLKVPLVCMRSEEGGTHC